MDVLPDPHGRFQEYVHGRLGLASFLSVRWLDGFRLHQAEECCWRLGSATRRNAQSHLDHAKEDPIGFQIACDEGMAICEGGRDAVEAMLDRLADHPDNKSGGPIGAYGPFYRWLDIKRRKALPPHVVLLREILTGHALREIPFMQDDRLFGEPVLENVHISTRAAALQMPLQYRSFLRSALEEGLMDEKDVHLRRFRLDRLEALAEARRQRPISRREFVDTFGIGNEGYDQLMQTKRIAWVEGTTRASSGIERKEYARLLNRIGMNKRPVDIDFEYVTLGDKSLRRIHALIALIDGSIVSVGALSPGDPLSLVLPRADVDALGIGLRRVSGATHVDVPKLQPFGPTDDTRPLSFEDLRLRLGVRAPLLRDLLAAGLFDVAIVPRTKQQTIAATSVSEFERTHILSRDLHREFDISWGNRIRDAMVEAGMTVVRLPRHPLTDLLRRDEILAYLPTMRKLRHDWYCDYHRDHKRRRTSAGARAE